MRPSSKASREAALSKVTSDDSQPPLGTIGDKNVVSRRTSQPRRKNGPHDGDALVRHTTKVTSRRNNKTHENDGDLQTHKS